MTRSACLTVARRGAASVITELASRAPVGLRPLAPAGTRARVAVVQTSACLVAGDDVVLEVRVGPGASLEIVELSATLAHPVTAKLPAIRQTIRVEVGADGRLLWLAEPLILAAATRMHRRLDVTTATGSRALLGESVVLGRDGEHPGAATTRLRITRDGRAVLDDSLRTDDAAVLRCDAVVGTARVCASLTLVGVDAPDPLPAGALRLEAQGTTLRCLGAGAVEVRARLAPVASAWGRVLGGQSADGAGSDPRSHDAARPSGSF